LFVAEFGNATVRKVSPIAGNWVVTTIAGRGTNGVSLSIPNGVAVDGAGNVFVIDNNSAGRITELSPNGTNWTVTTLATNVNGGSGLGGLAVDSAGTLYFPGQGRRTIRKLELSGSDWVVSDIAGMPGVIGSADGTNTDARFNLCDRIAVDTHGTIYVGDYGNQTIRVIRKYDTNYVVTTLAGVAGSSGWCDGPGATARFSSPEAIAVDAAGNVYVGDAHLRKITPDGFVTTLAGNRNGVSDGLGASAGYGAIYGAAVDANGYVYFTDSGNNTIRRAQPVNIAFNNPAVVATNASTAFGFGVTLLTNLSYRIQISSNLINWTAFTNFTATNPPFNFVDSSLSTNPARFYRVVTP
jgi:sugar lactone lactonase YvrE